MQCCLSEAVAHAKDAAAAMHMRMLCVDHR